MRFLQVGASLETLAKYDGRIYGVPLGTVQRLFGATPMYWLNSSALEGSSFALTRRERNMQMHLHISYSLNS